MEDIIVEIYVPANSNKYDFIIPSAMNIGLAAEKLAQAISEYEQNISFDMGNLLLCLMDDGDILDSSLTMEKAQVTSGKKLLLL